MPHGQLGVSAATVAVAAGLSAALIVLLKPLLARYFLAEPTARSSHSNATPQGAGLALMLSVLAVCAAVTLLRVADAPSLVPVLAAAIFLTVLGALDDARALPVSWRFIGQTLAALAIVVTLPAELRVLPDLLPFFVERGLMVFGTIWFVNAVNFLDGLDWMTVAQVVPMTLGIAVLHGLGAVPESAGLLALALLGATLGFALFNKHPAQVFLGDAGSLPIGLCLAYLLIFVASANLAAALLLSLYTLADATLTLFRRIVDREPILSPHKSHFYQRAVARGLAVPQVTARIFPLGFVLVGLAVAAVLLDSRLADLLLLALGALATGFTLFRLSRGR